MEVKVLSLLCCLAVVQGHLLPQALEDVHSYVQKELSQRSQGLVGIEGPPISAGGRTFTTTQTFFGTPVVIQKEMRLDGKGGIQLPGFPIHSDLKTAASTSLAHAIQAQLPPVPQPPPAPAPAPGPPGLITTKLVPPVPLALNPGDQAVQASSHGPPAIIAASMVGPSQFLNGLPPPSGARGPPPPPSPPIQYQQTQQVQYQQPQPPPPQQYQPPIQQNSPPQYQPPQQQAPRQNPIPQYQPPQQAPRQNPPPQYQPPQQQAPRQNPPPAEYISATQQAIRQIPPPQYQSPRQNPSHQYQQQQSSQQDDKRMQGWVPLDNEGSRLAKGVGIKLQVDDDLRQNQNQNQHHHQQQKQQHQQQRHHHIPPSPSTPGIRQQDRKPEYEQIAYTVLQQEDNQEDQDDSGKIVRNELEIIQTNNVKLNDNEVVEDIIIKKLPESGGSSRATNGGRGRHPVYPKEGKSAPKVVIHAQNVIIRGGPDGGIEEIQALNDTNILNTNQGGRGPSGSVTQYQAYNNVPQVTNFLRDQLRNMAMQHLFQAAIEEHPLNKKQPFPRPLSLRELAAAVRNGEFPQPTRDQLINGGILGGGVGGQAQDPMSPQPSMLTPTQMQFSIPHTVQVNPALPLPSTFDPLTLPSISSPQQHKVVLPGNLGNLYKNLVQQEALGGGGPLFDPTQPLDLSILQALNGQRSKRPITGDYGDSVKYTTANKPSKEEQKDQNTPENKKPIQILEAQPQIGLLIKNHQNLHAQHNTGNLKDMSDQILKQLLIQELQDVDNDQPPQQQQVLLPVGLGGPQLQLQRPLRLQQRPAYGTNTHPFAFLAEDGSVSQEPHVFEETIEYTLPPGVNVEEYLKSGASSHGFKKRPKFKPSHHHHGYGGDDDDDLFGFDSTHGEEHGDPSLMPLNGETMKQLGKGLLSSALQFSRHHNPLTLLQRIRSLPPVKVDLYKVPVGIPESLLEKMPKEFSFGSGGGKSGGHHHHPSSRGHGRRQRKKNLPRKNNKYY